LQLLNIDKKYYCGIDLHGKTMYTTIQDKAGSVIYHKNLPNSMDALRDALLPFRNEVAVGVESTFNWYWLSDACRKEGIPFYLGHALYMKAIHGGKNKNDRMDSRRIADLLRTNFFPMAYAYPLRCAASGTCFAAEGTMWRCAPPPTAISRWSSCNKVG
jgi:transposase